MAVTFGYYLRTDNDEITELNPWPYIYTLQYELTPIEILSITSNQALNSQIAVVGETPIITPLGISIREVTIRGKFAEGLSAQMPPSWVNERTIEDYMKEGFILRVHKDPGYAASELVNFPYTTSINLSDYPYKNDVTCPAYWTISSITADQKIAQRFGRYEFDLVLSYNWLFEGESLWRF